MYGRRGESHFINCACIATETCTRVPRRVITYVLLCGYSPFRAEDTKEMIKETTEARIEFHERYWSKISDEGRGSASLPLRYFFTDGVQPKSL